MAEVLWKNVTGLLNQQLAPATTFHDVMHGFWAGRRTGTAAPEVKLLQQLTSMREAVLFEVFLDLQKLYGALDWDRCLDILVAYGVQPRTIRLLWTYWDRLTMVVKRGGYFGLPFKGYHIVTQGNPLSLKLFNVVMDAVIRHCVTVVVPNMNGLEGLDLSIGELVEYFYDGDVHVASTRQERLYIGGPAQFWKN